MSRHSLTRRRVDNARPRKEQYEIADRITKGLFLRVYPRKQGDAEAIRKNWFLRINHERETHFINIGDAAITPPEQARAIAGEHIARIKAPANTAILFEHVAAEFFTRYPRQWHGRTLQLCRQLYRLYIEAYFTGKPIDAITHRDVQTWFATLAKTPTAANRTLSVLSDILRESEQYGYRREGSNPCQGIKHYRLAKREKYLTDDEIVILGAALRKYEGEYPDAVSAIRLMLLTGCRRDEIVSLRWRYYRDGRLHLPDRKTGPRIIYLCSTAREILAALRKRGRKNAQFVFPARRSDSKKGYSALAYHVWTLIREEIGLETLRLHDLRHTYASYAMRHGSNIRVIAGCSATANATPRLNICISRIRICPRRWSISTTP